jgi:hypothetical protein
MTETNIVPADTLEFFRLRRELRDVSLPLDQALFSALRESFTLCLGRSPQSSRELAEYYIEMSEGGRNVLRKHAVE